MSKNSCGCRSVRLVLLGLIFLLAGCIDSEAPLSDPDKSTLDENLLGRWKLDDAAAHRQITFEKVAAKGFPPGIMRLTLRVKDKDGKQTSSVGFVFRSELSGKTYLNLCGKMIDASAKNPAWDKLRANGFNIFKYAVKKDNLTIWFLGDETPLKTAIANGRLKGSVRPQGYLDFKPTVHLEDTTANVARFVVSEDEKLFSEQKKFVMNRAR